MNTPASTASAITDEQIHAAEAAVFSALPDHVKSSICVSGGYIRDVARAVLALAAPTAQPVGQTVSREDFDKMSGDLTRAKNLLVRLYDQAGRDASPEKLRGMIEQSTGSWFVWGADRDVIAAVEPSQPAPVAKVESWTNGSYSRNYKLKWLCDVPEGTLLYASTPPAPAAPSPDAQDAARYRYLRDGPEEWGMFEDRWLVAADIYGQGPLDMDTAIDAALAASTKGEA